jgi:hypothetical protein
VRSAYTSQIKQLIGDDKAKKFDALYVRRSNFLHDGSGRGCRAGVRRTGHHRVVSGPGSRCDGPDTHSPPPGPYICVYQRGL